MSRWLWTALGTIIGSVLILPNAVAEPKGEGDAEQVGPGGTVEAALEDDQESEGTEADGPANSVQGEVVQSNGTVTYYWRGPVGEPLVSDSCPDGLVYQRVRRDTSTNPPEETVVETDCLPPDADPPDTTPPDLVPPAIPTVAEIRDIAVERIPAPAVPMSPDPEVGGVTGLEMWFWHEGPPAVEAVAEVRGYQVMARMTPSRYVWEPCHGYQEPEDADWEGARDCPVVLESAESGSEPDPESDGSAAAVTWMPETKGTYTVRHQVVWDGSWEFTGHGASASGTLPTVTTAGTDTIRVDEIRAELTETR